MSENEKIRLGENQNFVQNVRKKGFGDLTDMMSRNKMPHYITLHYITLHYITLHYITLGEFIPFLRLTIARGVQMNT